MNRILFIKQTFHSDSFSKIEVDFGAIPMPIPKCKQSLGNYMCVCVCVCEINSEERERERQTGWLTGNKSCSL